MGEHGDAFGRLHMLGLDELPKPVQQHLLAEFAGAGVIRLVLAHLDWAMAERHDLPRQPADDGISSVKQWGDHCRSQELDPPNGEAEVARQAAKGYLRRPAGLVGWRTIDERRDPHRQPGVGMSLQ